MIVGTENRRYLQYCGQIERLWTLSGTGIGVIKFALTSIHCGSFIMKGQVSTLSSTHVETLNQPWEPT
jgi:hypothetical protein